MNARLPILLMCGVMCAGCDHSDSPPAVQDQPPAPPLTVRITGHEFRWHIQYPGPDGAFDTPDDLRTERHLHLPERTPTTLELSSNDYVYSLYLPHVELLEIAVPGQKFKLEFDAGVPGEFELLGTQMCGYTHPNLLGELVVHSAEDYETWLDSIRTP